MMRFIEILTKKACQDRGIVAMNDALIQIDSFEIDQSSIYDAIWFSLGRFDLGTMFSLPSTSYCKLSFSKSKQTLLSI